MSTRTPSFGDLLEPPPVPVRRFTVEEYHAMIRAGLFDPEERFELLDGWIVPKMTRNPPHEVAMVLVQEALRLLLPRGWHLRVQSAIATATSEPEPDLAVVRGEARDYVNRHPGAGDIALVVEVADASLRRDRGLKKRIYAGAGIPAYWIVNLGDARVEVDSDPTGAVASPTYRQEPTFGVDDALPLVIEGEERGRIAVRGVLP